MGNLTIRQRDNTRTQSDIVTRDANIVTVATWYFSVCTIILQWHPARLDDDDDEDEKEDVEDEEEDVEDEEEDEKEDVDTRYNVLRE